MTWYVDDSVVYGQVPRLAPLVIAGLAGTKTRPAMGAFSVSMVRGAAVLEVLIVSFSRVVATRPSLAPGWVRSLTPSR
jgi:hypothetical protein